MKANEIKDVLLKELYGRGKSFCTTNFSACGLDECDIIMVTESMMIYEYEVKCTYSDFKADFKKTYKHSKLNGTYYKNPTISSHNNIVHNEEWYLNNTGTIGCPNHFYYVCKEGLIPVDEVPEYAGLIYVNSSGYSIIKKARKLHKHKCTEKLIFQICRALSARTIFGCSYMHYKNSLTNS